MIQESLVDSRLMTDKQVAVMHFFLKPQQLNLILMLNDFIMEKEKIVFLRNFLLRTFFIGLLVAIIIFIIAVAFKNSWEIWAEKIFGVEKDEVGEIIFGFFMNVRLVLLFLILSPAIALHWMSKKAK